MKRRVLTAFAIVLTAGIGGCADLGYYDDDYGYGYGNGYGYNNAYPYDGYRYNRDGYRRGHRNWHRQHHHDDDDDGYYHGRHRDHDDDYNDYNGYYSNARW